VKREKDKKVREPGQGDVKDKRGGGKRNRRKPAGHPTSKKTRSMLTPKPREKGKGGGKTTARRGVSQRKEIQKKGKGEWPTADPNREKGEGGRQGKGQKQGKGIQVQMGERTREGL